MPSTRHSRARHRNGAECPIYSNNAPPNGGAIKDPKEINARDIPSALCLSFSSTKRSATRANADVSASAEPFITGQFNSYFN